ncbi:nucleoporin protein Ndc1-Nup [Xylariales sp. AK1849]|nr:nucleoporin protein Ndc1-Nup [Xylariales sp. AK1849]
MAPPVVRRAPYKDFLQPCMQRRFASALLVLLAVAYVESLVLSNWNSMIWSWFPIGIAGFRALTIFGCALFVIILRIAHPHVGIRTTNSPFDTFKQNALSLAASETILTYAISAFLFSQVYLFAVADKANLHWITYHSGDRARLNERAVFYTLTVVLLGYFEGFMHLFLDYDRLILGTVKAKEEGEAANPPPKAEDPFEKLLKHAPHLIVRSLTISIAVASASYLLVYSIFRRSAWGWAMAVFRPFYNLPKTNIPPSHAPWSIWMLGRAIFASTLLGLLWGFSNAAFTFYLAKDPIKNGQPLTSESKDPNGSLLTGLKSKKARISSFAMWETALIARDFDVRRQAIFEDIDRKDGPMWSQIYKICLDSIKTLEKRIDDYGKPPAPPPATQQLASQTQPHTRVVEPPLSADVWQPAPPPKTMRDSLGKLVANVANSPGKKPDVVPFAKKTAGDVKDALLTKEQQEHLNRDGINSVFKSVCLFIVQTPGLGWPFRQLYFRRITTAVLGAPYGEVSVYVNAAFILSRLAVASLNEDNYGNVHRDVPTIIRTLTTLIKKLEIFKDNLAIHWTDVSGVRECSEVDELLEGLKDALARLVTAFEKYSSDLRLSRADLRLAKEAAEKRERVEEQNVVDQGRGDQPPEMRQVG